MKLLNPTLILILAIMLTQACKSLKTTETYSENASSQLIIFQNGEEILITNPSENLTVKRKKFSLRFYNERYDTQNEQFHAAQIAAFTDKYEYDKIKVGMLISDIPCYEPGSGMACAESGKYESLMFSNNSHHYTFYENAESKRLNLLENFGKLLKLEFEVNALYQDNRVVEMRNTKLDEFYVAFLIDRNRNGIIDNGELIKLTVRVK